MRLLQNEVSMIKNNILDHIQDAKIILFGSRVDDNKKGGDIDILIESKQNISIEKQIKILASIELSGLSRKVDLVIKTPYVQHQSIFTEAIKNGIVL